MLGPAAPLVTTSAWPHKPSYWPLIVSAREAGSARSTRDATRVVSRVARNGGNDASASDSGSPFCARWL
jgi:hypothetical protein